MDTEQQSQTTEHTTTTPKQKSKWRWVWRILLLILLLIFTPILWLMTGSGQRYALHLANQWIEGLTIGHSEGSLQDGLTINNVQFNTEGVEVKIGQTQLHLGLACLRNKEACIDNLALKDAEIVIDTNKLPPSQSEETSSGEVDLPIGISLKNIAMDNIKVSVDNMDIQLDHFQSGLNGKGKDLQLNPTTLAGLTLSLPMQAVNSDEKIAKENEKPIDWQALKQQLSNPLLSKQAPIQLPLNLDIPDFNATDIHIIQKQQDKNGNILTPTSLIDIPLIAIKAKSNAEAIQVSQLTVKSDKGNISGNGQITLTDNYPLNWQLHTDIPKLAEFKLPANSADLSLSGELFGQTKLALKTTGAIQSEIQGSVKLAEPKTPFELHLTSPIVNYPFIEQADVKPLKLQGIKLDLQGDLLNYQLNTTVNSSGMNLPDSQLKIVGNGGLTQFNLTELNLNALQGNAKLQGKVDWEKGVEWQSDLNLNNINTQTLLPEWAAILSGSFHTTGYAGRGKNGEQWAVNLNDIDLHGNLQQKQLQLKGQLTSDNQNLLNVQNARLIYGENTIDMQGIISEKSNFNATINAPNLQGLVPHLKASVNGKVKLLGQITEPSLDLDLTANNVSFDQLKLQHLTAKGKIATEQQIQGDLAINLHQFSYGEIKLDNANLTASGSEANHNLRLTSKGEPIGANLTLSGKFDRKQQIWQGQLANVTISSPIGSWQNDKTVNLTYHNKQIKADISSHCWRNTKINLCFPQNFSAGQEGKVPFEIKQFDLTMLQEYLAKDTQLTGIINAKGDAAWFNNKSPQVNLELTSNAIKLKQTMDYRTFPLTLTPVKINANLVDNNLKLNTDVRIENNGRLSSELWIKDIANRRALSGNINVDKLSLSLVSPLLHQGENIAGLINARLTVGGSALSPLLYGNLNLSGLKARSTIMPFDITGGNLAVNFNGATSTLSGNVQTTESNLTLTGDANWQKLDAWHTRINAKANRFRLNIPSIAKVDISPDIEVKATPNELILNGNIDIPWARIVVEELPESAVAISDDEVIMDRHSTNANKKAEAFINSIPQNKGSMAIKSNVTIHVGDDVRLSAYGLKTKLLGTIKATQGNKGLGLYGQVNLKDGTFVSFGQDLIIRKGLISFTGSPTQPTLDIEAIRNPEAMENSNITAGVKVTGIADAPEVKLFSNPSLSQEQTLSYILTGRGLESGDAGSSNSIAAALLGMSLSKSSKLVGGIGSTFGISDLAVTTAGIGDNTKVVVSGSLNPKFKVKYGVGIFAPLTELTLRYRLAPSLYLQWVSSINQAVDLLYHFEFD